MSSTTAPFKTMFVIKRNKQQQEVSFDKVLTRIQNLCQYPTPLQIDPAEISQRVIGSIRSGIETRKLDEHCCEIAANLITIHPDYGILASRIAVSNHHKNTLPVFSSVVEALYNKTNNKEHCPAVNKLFYEFVMTNRDYLDKYINYDRDYHMNYFGFTTLQSKYLLKDGDGNVVEKPQDMWMRVSVAIHMNRKDICDKECLALISESYDNMSMGYFTHATPTLFNMGTNYEQGISCILLGSEDSIDGIFKTISDCAKLSKGSAGIGVHFSMIRSEGSTVSTTNGISSGICPFLRVFNNTARAVDQGGKRKGSIAIYLEPWHPDIMSFLQLKRPHGDEHSRARDLFYAMWICDIFMERVRDDGVWSLFDPHKFPTLTDLYGEEFSKYYCELEENKLYNKQLKAREVWSEILTTQTETGMPYISYKDAVNKKTNHQNIGTIKSSNLCNEINLYSDNKQYANCILASLCLPMFVEYNEDKTPFVNYYNLHKVAGIVCRNLDKIIDINRYSVPESQLSNELHRPLGIGVQGLADLYIKMGVSFDSPEARKLNKLIFETIYHGALTMSHSLAVLHGPYKSFVGSPFSKGILQFDMWNLKSEELPGMWDWNTLKNNIKLHGTRNSTLTALMPTASTSQIQGNNECFEPYTSNIYSRKTLSGDFIVINEYLMRELIQLGVWNEDVMNEIILNNGSVQSLDIPQKLKNMYKTVWEISAKVLIDQSADRAPFIDQTQSLNIYMTNTSMSKLSSMHFYGWAKGLKTGMYYLRSTAATSATKFGLDYAAQVKQKPIQTESGEVGGSYITYAKKKYECTDDVCTSCAC
jgi:ribonucleoside-diphosphate reductase alpha subunit